MNAVFFARLPYPQPEQLVHIQSRTGGPSSDWQFGLSVPNAVDLWKQASVFQAFAFGENTVRRVKTYSSDDLIEGATTSPLLFRALGTRAVLGRELLPSDGAGSTPVVLLSYRLWHQGFADDSAIIGKAITIDGEARIVVGVMPGRFDYPSESQYWIPIDQSADRRAARRSCCAFGLGRLRKGISESAAATQLTTIARRLSRKYGPDAANLELKIAPFREYRLSPQVRDLRTRALLLGSLILLVAVLNVGMLSASRDSSLREAFAVRAALGARRRHMFAMYACEASILVGASSAVAFILVLTANDAIVISAGNALPSWVQIGVDWRVALLGGMTAIFVLIAVSIVSSAQAMGVNVADTLRGSSRNRPSKALAILVTCEVAVAVVAITLTTQTVGNVISVARRDVGMPLKNVIRGSIRVRLGAVDHESAEPTFDRGTVVRVLEQVPGVIHAGVLDFAPLASGDSVSTIDRRHAVVGTTTPNSPVMGEITGDIIGPGLIPLIRGRLPTQEEERTRAPVALINHQMAIALFENADPIDQTVVVRLSSSDVRRVQVIGELGNLNLLSFITDSAPPAVIGPTFDRPNQIVTLLVKTRPHVRTASSTLIQALASAVPTSSLGRFAPMATLRREYMAHAAEPLIVLVPLCCFVIFVTGLGIVSLLLQTLWACTREIGIRAALGATPRAAVWPIIGRVLPMVLIGTVMGCALTLGLGATVGVDGLGIGASTPAIAVALGVVVLAVGIAAFVPVRRAMRLNPQTALNQT